MLTLQTTALAEPPRVNVLVPDSATRVQHHALTSVPA